MEIEELLSLKNEINRLRDLGLSQKTRDEVVSKIDFEINKIQADREDFRCYQQSSSTGRCKCLKLSDCVYSDTNPQHHQRD